MTTRFAPFRDADVMARSLLGPSPRPVLAPTPPMDVVRSEEALTLTFDLPGVAPESIDLSVERNVLSLSAERAWNVAEDQKVLVRERRQGSVRRQLRLSEGFDTTAVSARYDNGVLTVTIPAAESARPSRIDIEVGTSAPLDPSAIEAAATDAGSDN